MKQEYYLGLDLSTQSLTATAIDLQHQELITHALNYDACYSRYGTEGGVIISDDPRVVHANPEMWIEALDDLFAWLAGKNIPPQTRAISISAQQHGTVYLNSRAKALLSEMDSSGSMLHQLKGIFSRKTCPVWMDSSTSEECSEITQTLGGDLKVVQLTGSVATERFAGPQIRKFWKESRDSYRRTEHITLISAFITSLLTGYFSPIDPGDGLGTNLADIHLKDWDSKALEAASPGLFLKLPPLLKKDKVLGRVSNYLVRRYGFSPDTHVINGSGDNPCSLVGLGLLGDPTCHAISMGTSDTYFGYLPRIQKENRSTGHIFGTADGRYMFLVCFKNGNLARDQIRRAYSLDWKRFSDILMSTPPGNNGRLMLAYPLPEITPQILKPGIHRFGGLSPDDPMGNVRAVFEGQAMAFYLHTHWTGERPKRILATAGASENQGLLKVIAQVFQIPVATLAVKESAALGAAFRAAHASLNLQGIPIKWKTLFRRFIGDSGSDVIYPDSSTAGIYHGENGLLQVYSACESCIRGLGGPPDREIEAFRRKFVA
ncbi:MAG: FGGY family carbohydrate kinase [Thermodesulfobacteriota bacterium]